MEHRENGHKTSIICRDEEARLLQLKLLASRDETAALQDKLSQRDERIAALTEKSDSLRAELGETKKAARAQETRMKKRDMELANLQVRPDIALPNARPFQLMLGSGRGRLSQRLDAGLE